MPLRALPVLLLLLLVASGCSSSSSSPPPAPPEAPDGGGPDAASPGPATKTDAEYKAEAVQGIHDSYAGDIGDLVTGAKALQAAAPTPVGRGWDATQDAAAIQSMKDAWKKCRVAYEHVEGAIAPIVPDIDAAIDARYDDFLTEIGPAGDTDLFDDKGVTGMHAVERILFVPTTPQKTVDFEKQLPGYKAAAFPATEAEAASFKTKLLKKLVDDVTLLQEQWQPAKIDAGIAWGGLVSLMNEQREKVNKAATGEEESRYAGLTLFDLRNNLEGTKKAYVVFQPWLLAHAEGKPADDKLLGGFDVLAKLYASYSGDAIPLPPPTWSALNPSPADLASPFGVLYITVTKAVDPEISGSVVSEMNDAANLFGFPPFKE